MIVLAFAVAAALAAGILIGLVLFLVALLRGLGTRAVLVQPADFQQRRIDAHAKTRPQSQPDVAWPAYARAQAAADLGQVRQHCAALYRTIWREPTDAFFLGKRGSAIGWWIFLPIPALTIATLLCAGGVLTACFTVFCAGAVALTVLWAAVTGSVVCILRILEAMWSTLRAADASCPSCYHVSDRPAYRCPKCSALHRDIRPGILGTLARRCACGQLLPTMVLRAAWRLEAVCQRCETPLRHGAAAVRDIRIPIFGGPDVGKTRFLYAAFDSLVSTGVREGIEMTYPDEESEVQAQRALAVIRSGQQTVKTSATLPRAFSVRIGTGATATLLHLFDAAGEHFRTAHAHDDLRFLETGHGLVYVIDPFAIGRVRDKLTGHTAAALNLAHAAAGDPESAYSQVVSRLRGGGIKPKSQRLAVVISKIDLLTDFGLDAPASSDRAEQWLYDCGLHNLVLAARQEFADVRYFTVASLSTLETTFGTDPGEALRWLLRSRGMRIGHVATTDTAGAAS